MGVLTKIYTTINNRILFDNKKEHPSFQKQQEYLNMFSEPKNMLERSFFKYQCLLFYSYSKKQKMLMNFISFFALIFLVPFYRIKGIKHDTALLHYQPQSKLLRKATKRIPIEDIYPDKLNTLCDSIVDYDGVSYSGIYLTRDAFSKFMKAVVKYPFCFHFHMVLLIRLAQACFLLAHYKPAVITTYVCEREFADPIITEYYEAHGVQYHGFMHGDYLYSLAAAFMHFTKYWTWADHYNNLFKLLRCSFQTEVYVPQKYSGIVKSRDKVEDYPYYATYYFGDETINSIKIVKKALTKIQSYGFKCKVRPHPRFSDVKLIKKICGNEILVENTSAVTIEDSLDCSFLTIALVSTVLSQAYYSGKKIIIDDISNPRIFRELRDKKYILIDKADMLLSELLEQKDRII